MDLGEMLPQLEEIARKSMLGDVLTLDIFIQEQSLTPTWVEQLLRHLWERGLGFTDQASISSSWDDELAGVAYRSVWKNDGQHNEALSLREFIQ
ncbi:MAG TPA: hypothetical protein VFV38_30540, partial [Ktedonobacteraceae bacterium]|nr:hypothetical protein [Ktedonobacteraceae bacterium]